MDCAEARKKTILRLAEELAAAETVLLTEHLAGCPACQEFADNMTETWQQLAEPEEDMLIRFQKRYRKRFLFFLCAAAVLIVILFILLNVLEY